MSTLHLTGISEILKGNIDFENDTFRLSYMATTYTPDAENDQFFSDTSANVAADSPTETLTGGAVTIDAANNRVEIDFADVSEASITTTTDKFQVYKWTGSASTSTIIGTFDITEGILNPVSGTLGLTFDVQGLFSVSRT